MRGRLRFLRCWRFFFDGSWIHSTEDIFVVLLYELGILLVLRGIHEMGQDDRVWGLWFGWFYGADRLLGCSWRDLSHSWEDLGCCWKGLGCSWKSLGCSWGDLGCSFEDLGCSFEDLGCCWKGLGCCWKSLGCCWEGFIRPGDCISPFGDASRTRLHKQSPSPWTKKLTLIY
jgi:hypothetical protein